MSLRYGPAPPAKIDDLLPNKLFQHRMYALRIMLPTAPLVSSSYELFPDEYGVLQHQRARL